MKLSTKGQTIKRKTTQIFKLKNTVTELKKNYLKSFTANLIKQKKESVNSGYSFEIIQSKEQKGKKMKKSEESPRPRGYQQVGQYAHYRSLRRGKKRKGDRKYIGRNYERKIPKTGDGGGHPDSESPKDFNQDEYKEVHTNIHYKQIVKSQKQRKNLKATREK